MLHSWFTTLCYLVVLLGTSTGVTVADFDNLIGSEATDITVSANVTQATDATNTTTSDGNGVVHAYGSSDLDARTNEIVGKFSSADILGQMTQLTIASVLDKDTLQLDENKVRLLAKARVGSFLDSPFAGGPKGPDGSKYGWTAQEWRAIVQRIQEIYKEEEAPPVLFGIDAAHGATYVSNAVLFGQQLNGAASFNPDLVHEMGRITGRDTEAAGLPWVFGPMLEISQNPLWARTWETFGEDPFLVSVMADAVIRGLQSNDATAACMKHFIGYSKTPSGHDRDGVTLSDFDLLNYFAPPFLAAINAGVSSAMENYISLNGEPVMASAKILRDLLRTDMHFDGVLVSDWQEINNLHAWHRVVKSTGDAVRLALTQTSIDMSMVPYDTTFIDSAQAVLNANSSQLPRFKDSARRIVKMKLKLGLYDNSVPSGKNVDLVGGPADVAAALELARESVVLLQNRDGVLPLDPAAASVFLTGHNADNVGHQCGGWSVRWQGYSGNTMFPHGVSIKQGFEAVVSGSGGSVKFFNGLSVDGSYSPADMATAKSFASAAAYTVVVIGEGSYTEKPGDIDDLALPKGQVAYVRELVSTGAKVVLVLVGGRPRLLDGLPKDVHAVINAMLPCELGGQAVAEIVFGKVNPSGRMPITYPRDAANIMIPYNHRVSTQCSNGDCQMEWNFGAGLSYTTFTYSDLKLSKSSVNGQSDSLVASVTVTNKGSRAGKETVMLFVTQPFRRISVPEVKKLRKFTKISLAPGASSTVEFTLTAADWSVFAPQIGQGFHQIAEDGDFVVAIKPETDCKVYDTTAAKNPLCATFTLISGGRRLRQ